MLSLDLSRIFTIGHKLKIYTKHEKKNSIYYANKIFSMHIFFIPTRVDRGFDVQ